MALTAEQQSTLDYEKAMNEIRNTREDEIRTQDAAQAAKHRRLEMLRLAKEVLAEADRSKAVEDRGYSASDIVSFAVTLETHINS